MKCKTASWLVEAFSLTSSLEEMKQLILSFLAISAFMKLYSRDLLNSIVYLANFRFYYFKGQRNVSFELLLILLIDKFFTFLLKFTVKALIFASIWDKRASFSGSSSFDRKYFRFLLKVFWLIRSKTIQLPSHLCSAEFEGLGREDCRYENRTLCHFSSPPGSLQ